MRSLLTLVSASLFGASLAAQDFIYYRFDSGCTNEVINYASGAQALPNNGELETTTPTTPWTAGRFGSALAGGSSSSYNRVRTGWDPSTQPITGDVTIAFFMKETTAPTSSANYLMGAPSGGFRLFTNGVAGRGLYQRVLLASGGNGINATIANDFYLPATTTDVQTLAARGWVHIAMVVDATSRTADWYVNGVSVMQLQNVVGGANIVAAGPFHVGYSGTASYYAFDEFLLSRRAYSAAEVLSLSHGAHAGDGHFSSGITSQCGTATLSGDGTAPYLGNAGYALRLSTTATGSFALNIGLSRCSIGGATPLPLDAGTLSPIAAGCWILTDTLTSAGGGLGGGTVQIPLGIPILANLAGLDLYAQGLVLILAPQPVLEATGGVALGLGY